MGRAASYLRKYTTKNMHQPLHTNKKRYLSTRSEPSTSFRDFGVGVCISETKHNRKSSEWMRWRDTGGRLRERGGTRADVNKPRSELRPHSPFWGSTGPGWARSAATGRVVESGYVVSQQGQHKHSVTQDGSAHALSTNEHETSRSTLRSRPAPNAVYVTASRSRLAVRGASERRPRAAACTVPRSAPPPALPTRPAPRRRRARPTSGESRTSTRRATN